MPETCSFMTTALSGRELLVDPQLNKGTAFSETERCTFDLHGLLTLNVRRIADRRARLLIEGSLEGLDLKELFLLLSPTGPAYRRRQTCRLVAGSVFNCGPLGFHLRKKI